jgi:hypothetical protein
MSTLGFEEYVEPLRVYLQSYRESEVCSHFPFPHCAWAMLEPRGASYNLHSEYFARV